MTKKEFIELNEALSNIREAYDTIEGIKQNILDEMRHERRCGCVQEFLEETPYERMDVATDMLQFTEDDINNATIWLERSIKMCKSIVKLP